MPTITDFDANLGISAGRLAPTQAEPLLGSYALVLGDENHAPLTVSNGDFTEVIQRCTLPGTTRLVRIPMLITAVQQIGGVRRVSVVRNDVERVVIDTPSKPRTRLLRDVALPIAVGGETVDIALRLTIAGVTDDTEAVPPAVYIDAIAEDDTTDAPILINRNPEPGDTQVPVSTPIALEVHNPTGLIDPMSITIYVGGVLAYSAGVAQAGFSDTTTSLEAGRTIRVELQPDAVLDSLVPYEVEVHASTGFVDGVFTYSFTTEDLIPPTFDEVLVTSHTSVRVRFNEPMTTAGEGSVLDLLKWGVSLISTSLDDGLPAVPLNIVSIVSASTDNTEFDITFDWEMTADALYRIDVVGATDVFNNILESAFLTFAGYRCPAPDRRRFTLYDFLPEMNRREDYGPEAPADGGTRDLEKLVRCWQEVTDLILCDIDRWTEILDVDTAPEAFIDAMLADLGNPFQFALSGIDKRRLVLALVPMFQQKGTTDGIKNIVRFFLGLEVDIVVPWHDGGWILDMSYLDVDTGLSTTDRALRYSFYVTCVEALTPTQVAAITDIANYVKAAHEHLLGVFGFTLPPVIDHWQLNLSRLDVETALHA